MIKKIGMMIFVAVILTMALTNLPAVTHAASVIDGFDPNINGPVYSIAMQADGKIVVGGSFTTTGGQTRNRIARLNPDGALDTSFNPDASYDVNAVVIQPDGKILAGGNFSMIGGMALNRIARLNADGTPDPAFNPNANNNIFALALQPDGKIVVGGAFTTIGGLALNRIARLNPDGTPDATFNPNVSGGEVQTIIVLSDGKIVVGGLFTSIGGQTKNHIARLNSDGTLDAAFDPDSDNWVYSLAQQADGKIVVGGWFSSICGQSRSRIARLYPDGTLDTSFNPNVNSNVLSLALQPDGKILVGGDFATIGGQSRSRIARLHLDGTLDSTFNPNANSSIFSIALQSDNKIIAGGGFSTISGQVRNKIARLNLDGTADSTLNPNIDNSITNLFLQPDGKMIVSGLFTTIGGVARNGIARLNPDGTPDTFNPSINNNILSHVLQPDGKILIGGNFTSIGGQTRNRIARLNPDGTLDTFNPNANDWVYSIAQLPDGKIIAGGMFTRIGEQARNYLARLNPDGTIDSTFAPGINNYVYSLALQPDGKILVGGYFTNIDGQARNYIARLNSDGTLDQEFNPNADSTVMSLVLYPDGKIFAVGNFNSIGGGAKYRLARLNPGGTLDTTFNANPSSGANIYSLALHADGKITVGGTFTSIGEQLRNKIARLNADGTAVTTFNPGSNNTVTSLAIQPDGKTIAGGFFTTIGGQPRNYIARLSADEAAVQSLEVSNDGATTTWLRSGSSPEVTEVAFEHSSDLITWTALGSATNIPEGWQLSALSLPFNVNHYLRATGKVPGARYGLSTSQVESVRLFYNVGHLLTFNAGAHGSISGAANQTVSLGGSATAVTANPVDAGYSFVNWTGTGGFVTSTANPLTVTNVTSGMEITANFADMAAPVDDTLTATPGFGQIVLTWTAATDNVGVTGYKVVFSTTATPIDCNGAAIYSGTDLSFPHTALNNGATYYYRVCASDSVGNWSSGTTASTTLVGSCSWNSAVSGNWSDAAKWSCGHAPGAGENALITASGAYTVTMDVNPPALAGITLGGTTGVQTLAIGGRTISNLNGPFTIGPRGAVTMSSNTIISGSGSIDNSGNISQSGGNVTVNVPVNNSAVITQTLGVLTFNGAFSALAGSTLHMNPSGLSSIDMTFANGFINYGTINLGGAHVDTLRIVNGTLINVGTIAVSGVNTRNLDLALDNRGVFSVNIANLNNPVYLYSANGSTANSGTITINSGKLSVSNGSATIPLNVTNTGTITIASGQVLIVSKSISGDQFTSSGIIEGAGSLVLSNLALNNSGILRPGIISGAVTGKLLIDSALGFPGLSMNASSQTSMEIGGTATGSYDVLAVTNGATLNGALNVSLINGFAPSIGDSFTIMTYGSRSGSFSTTNLPALSGGKAWNLDYQSGAVVLGVVSSDIMPPAVETTNITDGATGVNVTQPITVTFSEAMDPASITAGTLLVNGGAVSGAVSYDAPTRTASFKRYPALAYDTTYSVTIKSGISGVKDLAGNSMAADYTWGFTSGSMPAYGHILDDKTVALWRLNETSASAGAVDETGAYPLTQFGNPDVISGKIDSGRLLGGTTKYFQGAGGDHLGTALNGDWTYEGWVYLDPSFNTQAELFIYNGLAFSYNQPDTILAEIGIMGGRKIYWHQWQNTGLYTEISSNTTLQTGQYHHLAVSRTAEGGNNYTYRIYVNGILDKTTTGVAGLSYTVTGVSHYIGLGNFTSIVGFGRGGNVLNGRLDDTRISKVARSDAEILESSRRVATAALTVTRTGSGSGKVASSQFGIDCGDACSADFPINEVITLTADPAPGSTFLGWSEGCAGQALSCTVTMNTAVNVFAGFGMDTLPPTDGVLDAAAVDSQNYLSWSGFGDNTGITFFTLVTATTGQPANCSAASGVTVIYNGPFSSYLHTGLTNGTTYYYRLCATDAAGLTSGGVTASATPATGKLSLVSDANTQPAGSNALGLYNANGTLYLSATNGVNGHELFKSDGTQKGTVLVKDINPGIAPSSPAGFSMMNGIVYFVADDGVHGRELWRTDGTAGGTFLVKDINQGVASSDVNELTVMNNTLYFTADDGVNGGELWTSDGSEAGTKVVKDINPGAVSSSPQSFMAVGNTLFFWAYEPATGMVLWKSDGSAAGTVLVMDMNAGVGYGGGYNDKLYNVNGLLLFTANNGINGIELWRSDGTIAGTYMVKDIKPGSRYGTFGNGAVVGNILYFQGDDATAISDSNQELWRSDGTAAGTYQVKEIAPGFDGQGYNLNSVPYNFSNINGTLFFTAKDATNGYQVWKSDGTSTGTVMLKQIGTADYWNGFYGPESLTNVNGTLYFNAYDGTFIGRSLWKSDGTAAGTVKVTTKVANPANLTAMNGILYFTADDGVNGAELWRSDGTDAGTYMMKINTLGSASLIISGEAIGVNDILFYNADDGVHGSELWKSDGTAAGTVMVKDIVPGAGGSAPHSLTNVNGALFFWTFNNAYGPELWKSDGTVDGTVLVKAVSLSDSSFIMVINGVYYFSANDGTSGTELWKSDGTAAGTVMVKDIRAGEGGSSPSNIININGVLYFTADDGINGRELWKSDGSATGTVMVKDIYPGSDREMGPFSSDPADLTNMNGTIYFIASNGINSRQLWKSDGTEAGTVAVTGPEIWEAPPRFLTTYNGTLFFVADTRLTYNQLWKSDGTAAGTEMLTNVKPGGIAISGESTNFTGMGGFLYFIADDGLTGNELWKTDGSMAGTMRVKDIFNGTSGSNPQQLTIVNNTLFFTADDGINGVELWKTDGTADGTMLVKDIYPGDLNSSSYPGSLINFNGTLFFSADDGSNGYQLWQSDGTAAGTVPVKDLYPSLSAIYNPQSLVKTQNTLFFFADDGIHGKELHMLAFKPEPAKSKLDPAITWGIPASITYGTPLSITQLNATADVPGTFAYNPPSGTLAAGSHTLTVSFTPDDTSTSNNASANVSLTITPAILTVTAHNLSKTQGSANPELTYAITGFVNGDSASVVSGSPALSTTAVTDSPAGNYPITATAGSLSAANYTFSFANGAMAITPLPLHTVTLPALPSGTVSGPTLVNNGATATYTITPVPGYHFVDPVTGCGNTLTGITNSTNVVTFTTGVISANCAITANFEPNTFTVSEALKALLIAVGETKATPDDYRVVDLAPLVDGKPQPDGKIDLGDAVVILRRAVGLENW